MYATGSPSTSSLFRPLKAEDIVIAGETVQYDERRHWAILIEPFLETLAILVAITIFAGAAAGTRIGALLVLASIGYIIFRVMQGGTKQVEIYKASARYLAGFFGLYIVIGLMGALLGFGFAAFTVTTIALVIIILATFRFAFTAMKWLLYERLYITNRRVILAEGFLGSDISTMPLTRLTDLNYKTSITGELLGYALLRLETAGQDQALSTLNYLDRPSHFYAKLIDLSTAAVGSVTEVGGENGDGENGDGENVEPPPPPPPINPTPPPPPYEGADSTVLWPDEGHGPAENPDRP